MSSESNYFKKQRLSRRRVLAGTGAAGLGALALAACGGADDEAPQATATPAESVVDVGPQTPGGTAVISISSDPSSFDFQTQFVWHQTAYMNRLFRYKTGAGVGPNYYEVIPDLATSWEQPQGDTLTVKLNPNAKFHNKGLAPGRVLSSEDVKISLEMLATNKPNYVYRYLTDFITGIETPDAQTAVFKLQYPTGLIFNTLAYFQSAIAPREYIVRDGNLTNVDVGTGPFILEKYERSVGWTFKKNPEYFVKDRPFLDGIDMPFIADANANADAFRVGRLDTLTPSASILGGLKATLPASSYVHEQAPGIGWAALWPNVEKAPFNDLRLRQALSLAIDRDQVKTLSLQGNGEVRTGPISRGWTQWSRSEADILADARQDLTQAKQLLSAAGHGDGLSINYPYWGSNTGTIEVIQQQLSQVGLEVKLQIMELLAWQDKLTRHDFELANWSMRAYADPDDYLYPTFYPGGSKNYGVANDQKLTDLILKQRQATTNEERKQVLLEIERRWTKEFLYGIFHVESIYNHLSNPRLVNYGGRNPADHAVWANVSIKS